MIFSRLLSPCLLWGHDEPIREIKDKQLTFVCPRCCQEVGIVLPDQASPSRPIQPLKAKKVKKKRVRVATTPTAVVTPFAGRK